MPGKEVLPYPSLAVTRKKGSVYQGKAQHGYPGGEVNGTRHSAAISFSLPNPTLDLPLPHYTSFNYFSSEQQGKDSGHMKGTENIPKYRLQLWSKELTDGIASYGVKKGKQTEKRNKGLLKNAEKPNESIFWKERGVSLQSSTSLKDRPKSHSISSEKTSKERGSSRPRTSKSDGVSGIHRLDSRTSDNYKLESSFSCYKEEEEEEELDPDVVSPNHLIDVLESENVTVPTTGCYSALSDYSHVRATPIQIGVRDTYLGDMQNARDQQKLTSPSSESLKEREEIQKKVHKNGKVNIRPPSKTRPYVSILETLRDKYAFNIHEDSAHGKKQTRRNITISNIGEVTKLTVKSDGTMEAEKPKRQPTKQLAILPRSPPNTPNLYPTPRKSKLRLLHTSQDKSDTSVPMLIEIKTVPYKPKSTFYGNLQSDRKKQHTNGSFDACVERSFPKKPHRRTVAHISHLRTDAPNNTPQPSLFDPSDICGNAY